MYNVSNEFKNAMLSPAQEHRLTGTIGSISFDESNIVEGSFRIQNQCTKTDDVVLGSVFVGELTAEIVGIDFPYGDWIGKTITPTFALKVGNNWENVPLGIFKVKEANHTAYGVQITAYDNMIKFDKKFKKSHFQFTAIGTYPFIQQICLDCGVTCANTEQEIEAMPNGQRVLEIYGAMGKKSEFANDIETYRDLLFWVAQAMGCFATINRAGQLEFRRYTQTVVDEINEQHRLTGATFADYVTHYIGIYVDNLDTNTFDYYGYDAEALQQELDECIEEANQILDDMEEVQRKYDAHEITEEEYNAQMKALQKEHKKMLKRIAWLTKALQQTDDGASMDLGANPLLCDSNLTTRYAERRAVLKSLDAISYTPFSASCVHGVIYDLGDVIQFSGGLYNSENDSFGCVMSWTYTHNGGTELEGFGVDPAVQLVRTKTQKSADRANKNSVDATHNSSGDTSYAESETPGGVGKDGDMRFFTTPPIKFEFHKFVEKYWSYIEHGYNGNGGFDITLRGHSDPDVTPSSAVNAAIFKAIGFGGAGKYHISCKMQFSGYIGNPWGANNMGLYISYDDSGIYYGGTSAYGELSTTPLDTFLLNMYYDNNEHEYSADFTIDAAHASSIVNKTMYIALVVDRCWKYGEPMAMGTLHVDDLKITGVDTGSGSHMSPETEVIGADVKIDEVWKEFEYIQKANAVLEDGIQIAELISRGKSIPIYAPESIEDVKVDGTSVITDKIANINTMQGATAQEDGAKGLVPTPTAADSEKYLKGDGTWGEPQGGGGSAEMLAPTPFIYSETEEQVGIWIDGKPLYQKTIPFSAIAQGTTNVQVICGLDHPDIIVDIRAFAKNNADGNAYFSLPLALVNNNQNSYGAAIQAYTKSSDSVRIDMGTDRSAGGGYITIKYTKTTDTAWQGGFKAYGFSPVIYSDTEREIGVWRDGKPLYAKTINIGALPNTNVKYVDHNIANVDRVVNIFGYTFHPTALSVLPLPYSAYTPATCIGVNAPNKTQVQVFTGNDRSGFTEAYLTIQYTKTTDTAGSGKYTTLGTPAVHYSTDEQIIGTWIDGKTLYQKTISCGALPNAGTKQVSHGVSNIDTIVSVFGFANGGSGCMPIPYSTNNINANIGVNIPGDNASINLFTGSDRSNIVNTYITIQYTKSS